MEYFNDNFDFSEIDKFHDLYDCKNKKVIDKFKLETSLIGELTEFIALRSKSYSVSYGAKAIHSKQKGIEFKCEKLPNLVLKQPNLQMIRFVQI